MLPHERITLRSRLGFIGLGYLGSRIARRLVTARFPMVVYDLDDTKTVKFSELGADVAWNPSRLAGEVDVVLSCLPDEQAVQAAYLGAGNILDSARPGTRFIELSTILPIPTGHSLSFTSSWASFFSLTAPRNYWAGLAGLV